MTLFLVVRPEPGASATAARIRALGGEVVAAPLFVIEPAAWEPSPPEDHDALMITSAHAVRQAGEGLALYLRLPAYAVGAATAAALTEAGFADVRIGSGDAEALADRLAADGRTAPLHLAGEDYLPIERDGLRIGRRIVYRARAIDRLPEALRTLPAGAIALLHSPRAARHFAALLDRAQLSRRAIGLAAISAATLAAAGDGWRATAVSATPDDQALLAATFALCEGEAATMGRRI